MKKILLAFALTGAVINMQAQSMYADTTNPLLTQASQIEVSSLATDEGSIAGLLDNDFENNIQDDVNFVCVSNLDNSDQSITVTLPSAQQNVQVQLRERWAPQYLNPGWTYDWAPRETKFQVSSDGNEWTTIEEKPVTFNTEFKKDGSFVTIDLKHTTTFNYIRLLFVQTPDKKIVQLGELKVFPLKATTTGVNKVIVEKTNNNAIYDLQGRRVENPKHGIYIQAGKKVVL